MSRLLAVVPLIAALCACAEQPVRYAPLAAPAERLPTAKLPKLLLEEASDKANPGDLHLGAATGASPDGALDPKIEWPEVVRAALASELQRLGWPATQNRSFAGPRLKATLESAYAKGGAFGHVDSRIKIGLVLKESDGRTVWEGRLEGAGSGTAWTSIPEGFRMALNAALNAAIPRLGPLLAAERPWEMLGNDPVAAGASASAREPAVAAQSDVDQLPAARAARPRSYAVVIGIERYRENLPNADFAAGDAKLAAGYFERVLGVPESNVALLLDDRATKSDLEKYIEGWLPNHVEAGDTVYVYYSGHGAPNPAKGDAYLVPYDGDPTYIEKTGYPVKRLFEQLSKLPAQQVYVAMDSCFSGAGGRSVIAPGARPLVSVAPSEVPANVSVLAASAGDQVSNGYREKGHGLFTYFFLKGLKEKGDDFRAVFDYLKPEVSRVARREDNVDQVPQWRQGR